MRFFQITSALALATAANAAMSASTMQSNIDQITELSSDTNEIAESLSVTNIFQKAPVWTPKKVLRSQLMLIFI